MYIHSKQVIIVRLITLIVAGLAIVYINPLFEQPPKPYFDIFDMTNNYGFVSGREYSAFEDILRKSDIMPYNVGLKKEFRPTKFADEFVPNVVKMLKYAQDTFYLRKGNMERWEISEQEPEWVIKNRDIVIYNLKTMGFIEEIGPYYFNFHDTICILGSTADDLQSRIDYADSLVKSNYIKPKNVILLAGERYVIPEVDGDIESLKLIAQKYKLDSWKKVTETHLIKDIYEKSYMSQLGLNLIVIDTPKGKLSRPTTSSTMMKLKEHLKDNAEIKNIAFISNQPYVKYQKAVIDMAMWDKSVDVNYSVYGNGTNTENLNSKIEALGSLIFASTPFIFMGDKCQLKNKESLEIFQEIYKDHPLIYSNLSYMMK